MNIYIYIYIHIYNICGSKPQILGFSQNTSSSSSLVNIKVSGAAPDLAKSWKPGCWWVDFQENMGETMGSRRKHGKIYRANLRKL